MVWECGSEFGSLEVGVIFFGFLRIFMGGSDICRVFLFVGWGVLEKWRLIVEVWFVIVYDGVRGYRLF